MSPINCPFCQGKEALEKRINRWRSANESRRRREISKVPRTDLKSGNSETIASMLAGIRETVYRKASALKQDAPLSLYFDARWGVGGND